MVMSDFDRCTILSMQGSRCTISCIKGLWSVEGPCGYGLTKEAENLFQQYKEDGEYSRIIARFDPDEEDDDITDISQFNRLRAAVDFCNRGGKGEN